MKPSTLFSGLLTAWASSLPVASHPTTGGSSSSSTAEIHKLLLAQQRARAQQQQQQKRQLGVDLMTQPISTTGSHAFVPPDYAAGDQRGPCPGLNALANHGYLAHSGVTTLLESIEAVNSVYGMGADISTILSIFGTVWTGNPVSASPGYSIGGADARVQNLLGNAGGLLGAPRGLNGSHNLVEADSSATRNDFYAAGGDASTMNMTLWERMRDTLLREGALGIDVLADFAALRFDESVATNPYFYYGPYTGFFARNTGYYFMSRLFANYSWDNPDGIITEDILKQFYAVEGEPGNFTYRPGHERIPDNWYRTPIDYMLVQFNVDFVSFITRYPKFASLGGNLGRVNSFTGLDITNITGGVLNAANMLEGNNMLCFVSETVKTFAPAVLGSLLGVVGDVLTMVSDALDLAALNISCPAFGDLTYGGTDLLTALQDEFPGVNKSGYAL